MGISANIDIVKNNIASAAIKSGRTADDVTILVVSKTRTVEEMQSVSIRGLSTFGENRVQEALGKMEELRECCEFHMIGQLQTNKVKQCITPTGGKFALIHSIDRGDLLDMVDRYALKAGIVQDILIQLNLAGEEQKGGVLSDDIDGLVQDCLHRKAVRLRGFMMVPPAVEDPEKNRWLFRRSFDIFSLYKKQISTIDILSIGMSDDYAVAVEEGSTMVRIGSAIFGKRQ